MVSHRVIQLKKEIETVNLKTETKLEIWYETKRALRVNLWGLFCRSDSSAGANLFSREKEEKKNEVEETKRGTENNLIMSSSITQMSKTLDNLKKLVDG